MPYTGVLSERETAHFASLAQWQSGCFVISRARFDSAMMLQTREVVAPCPWVSFHKYKRRSVKAARRTSFSFLRTLPR